MKSMPMAVLLALCLLLIPVRSAAQARSAFETGARLRIEATGYTPGRITGTVRAYTHEGLFVQDAATGNVHRIPSPEDIGYLALSRGYDRGYSAKKLALPSAFIAGSVGVLAGPLVAIAREDEHGMLRTAAVLGVAGALLGGLGGGAYGATHVREAWKVYRLRPFAGMGRTAAAIGAELRLAVR